MPALAGDRPQRLGQRRQTLAHRHGSLRDPYIAPRQVISRKLSMPNAERIFIIRPALQTGFTIEGINNLKKIGRRFPVQVEKTVD